MTMMRRGLLALACAAALAGCGGGDPAIPGSGNPAGAPSSKGTFTAVVSFGDSLSDLGAYAPATSLAGNGAAPYFGGKFTTNNSSGVGPAGTVWVENLATTLGLLTTPAEVGLGTQSVKCPAAQVSASLAGTCTGYGQGGALVTNPNGTGKSSGFLTVPMVTQIANHLARFGSFKSSDLVVLWGGNNDALTQFGAFVATATQIQTDAATGKITPDQANKALYDAQTAAQYAVKTAALELSGYVKDQVLAKGGKYVAVLNLPDSAQTPFGSTLPASAKPVLTTLVDTFNLWLKEGLTNQPVLIVDLNALNKDATANPAKYGMVNNTVPACDAAKIKVVTGGAITDGTSLFCNATPGAPYNGVRAGADVLTWQWADGIHPTTGGHKVISDYVTTQLKAAGWL